MRVVGVVAHTITTAQEVRAALALVATVVILLLLLELMEQ